MTDETRDEGRLETDDEQDVEAHRKLRGAMDESGEEHRLESDDDDVEGHFKARGSALR